MQDGKRNRGSITLEAAMIVPMFIALMLFVNGLFVLFMGQHIMSHTLIQTAKSMAYDPYASQKVSADEENTLAILMYDLFTFFGDDYVSSEAWYEGDSSKVASVAKKRFIAFLESSRANDLLDIIGVESGISGLKFTGSLIEDDVLTLKLKYKQNYIFDTFNFGTFDRTLEVKVKLFKYKG